MFVLHVIIFAVLGVTFIGLAINLFSFRSLVRIAATGSRSTVSILVPARDEERSIWECLNSLMNQDYPHFEILVLDDSSTDRTAPIVRAIFAGHPNHRLITGEPLPVGWTGKNWACHQLSQAATGKWLLFTDADTVHSPGALSAAISMAVATKADLFSAWPRLVTKTLGEKVVIPILHIIALGWFPIAGARFLRDRPNLASRMPPNILRACGAANGQFLLFRRAAYDKIGGHAAIRGHLVEDVALGRQVARRIPEGMHLVNCDGSLLIDCRMYQSLREVCDGFTKNARAAFEDSLFVWYLVGTLQFTVFFLPFILILFHSQFQYALIEVGLIYLLRIILALRMRTSWLGCLLHPVGQFLAMGIAIRSWINTAGSGVQWKGRTYHSSYTPPA